MPHGWLNDTMPGRCRAQAADEGFRSVVAWLRAGDPAAGSAADASGVTFPSRIPVGYDFAAKERLH